MKDKKAFGDFQTPDDLAKILIDIIKNKNQNYQVIVEPTCGLGSILKNAYQVFKPEKTLGIEINKDYTDILRSQVNSSVTIINNDYFCSIETIRDFIDNNQNVLFVGNPPWVTNSMLSVLNSNNVPLKKNSDNVRGIEAITGKRNFDISEFIIQQLIDEFSQKCSTFAFLCKTSVAKKIMNKIWKHSFQYNIAELYQIDTKKYFNASVDACLFYLDCSIKKENHQMEVYSGIENPIKLYSSGFINNVYFENIEKKSCLEFFGKSPFTWRNGIKHDCAKVMELTIENDRLLNGYGQIVEIESDLIFPYLKSSDVSKGSLDVRKNILVTQKYLNEPTDYIKMKFPKTWDYLKKYESDFIKRKSVIYKNKYNFSIFSVGDYTFLPYKIAISGLYQSLDFRMIKPINGKPVLLDDTCNYISFKDEQCASFVLTLLNSQLVKEYLMARISWKSKRPIKTEILNTINLERVAFKLGLSDKYDLYFSKTVKQLMLFA